jgi:kynurenine formamidase
VVGKTRKKTKPATRAKRARPNARDLSALLSAAGPKRPRIVDLSLPIQSDMPGIPGVPLYTRHPVKVQAVTALSEKQKDLLEREGVEVNAEIQLGRLMNTLVTFTSHIGTHVDAPRHLFEGGAAIDAISLDRIVMREAVVLDVSRLPLGAGIGADDLQRTGVKPRRDQVPVIKTLWTDRMWGKPEFWSRMPYMTPSAGDWILDRQVPAVALDCFPEIPGYRGVPHRPEERVANHEKWLRAGIIMIQLLTNLSRIGDRFILVALPLRLKGADGSPARVVGIEF